jgi:polyisoprenyl-phosphate glycosyltransferase
VSPPARLLSVVVPVFNEAENLEAFHHRLAAVADGLDRDVELIFVDDGSTDGSYACLEALHARDRRVRLVRLSRNFGSHSACLAGFAHARGDHAVILSADLQDPPELIVDLLGAAERGHDVVLGTREQRDDPWSTRVLAGLYHRTMRRIAMPTWPKEGFDFMLASRRALDVLLSRSERNTSVFGEILWSGFAQTTVPYHRAERRAGRSKWTAGKKLKLVIDACVAFSYLPIRAISVIGAACLAVGVVVAGVVVARFASGSPVHGWTVLLAALLGVGGIQIILLAIVGEYVWRAVDEVRGRPPFVVTDLVGFDEPRAVSDRRRDFV